DGIEFTVKFRIKEAKMAPFLKIMLNHRLLIDEIVLQGDDTIETAPLSVTLNRRSFGGVKIGIIDCVLLTCCLCHRNTALRILLHLRFSTTLAFADNFLF